MQLLDREGMALWGGRHREGTLVCQVFEEKGDLGPESTDLS